MHKIINSDHYPIAGESCIEAILDDDSDILNIPTDYAPGSVALVVKKSPKIYMLNASHEWKEL